MPDRKKSTKRPPGGRGGGLEAFLSGKSKPEDALGYREMKGFLFAVVSAPDMVPPSAWLPIVFGGGEAPPFKNEAQAQRVLGEVMGLYNELNTQVLDNRIELPEDCQFREDVLSNLSDDAPVGQWCRGFIEGHTWLEECWDAALPDELEEELGALIMTLAFFTARRTAEVYRKECTGGRKTLADLADTLRSVFPTAMAGYAQMGRSLLQAPSRPQAPAAAKVGRNDPCPCGSGKKHKKCCLVAPADLMEQAARYVRGAQGDVEPRIVRFLHSRFGSEAIDRAWEEFACGQADLDRDGPVSQLFEPWLLYTWIPELPEPAGPSDSRSVAALYLDEQVSRTAPAEAEFIRATCDTPFSFHEVLDVEPGRRLRLRDILLETECEVFERGASGALRVGDVVFGRVVTYEKVSLIIGLGDIPLPPTEKRVPIRMRERLRKEFGVPTAALVQAGETKFRELYLRLRDVVMHPAPPVLNNTDGEPIEFHTITCDVESAQAAFEALASLAKGESKDELLEDADLDADGRLEKVEFSWLKKGNKQNKSWDNTVLGSIVLEGLRLKAEVNSAGRARRLQKELRKRLGSTMRNLTVAIKPMEEAMADYQRIRDTPEERKRREEDGKLRASPEAREAVRQILEQRWEGWVDERIPALEGLTPREAVRKPDGREMVEALLLQFERRGEESGEDAYDFNRLRRKLGLPTRGTSPDVAS